MVSKGSKGPTISSIIYAFLDTHENYSLELVYDVHKKFKFEAVKSAFYRWHRKRRANKPPKRSDSISKNDGTDGTTGPEDTLSKLSPDLQNIKNIMQSFNKTRNTSVRFGEVANYLIKTEALNIVAEGVTKSLKRMDNTKLLQFIKPTPLLSEISREENLQEESLRSMSSLQRLNYLTKMKLNNSDKSELPLIPLSKNASSSEQEEEAKPST